MELLRWYIKEFDNDPFIPKAQTLPAFIDRFNEIFRARQRSEMKRHGHSNGAPKIYHNGYDISRTPVIVKSFDARTGKERPWVRKEGEYTEEELDRFDAGLRNQD